MCKFYTVNSPYWRLFSNHGEYGAGTSHRYNLSAIHQPLPVQMYLFQTKKFAASTPRLRIRLHSHCAGSPAEKLRKSFPKPITRRWKRVWQRRESGEASGNWGEFLKQRHAWQSMNGESPVIPPFAHAGFPGAKENPESLNRNSGFFLSWCRREDSNLHRGTPTRPWTLKDYRW